MSGEEIKIKNEKVLDGNPCQTNSDWFVRKGESTSDNIYPPREDNGFSILINGAVAFDRLQEQIEKAEKSIDIICWGFDPTLMLKGFSEGKDGERLGELLEKAADKGIKVRILIWEYMFPSKVPDYSVIREKFYPILKNYTNLLQYHNHPEKLRIASYDEIVLIQKKALEGCFGKKQEEIDKFEKNIYDSTYKLEKREEKIHWAKLPRNLFLETEPKDAQIISLFFSFYDRNNSSQNFSTPASNSAYYGNNWENRNDAVVAKRKENLQFYTRDPKNSDTARSLNNSKIFHDDPTVVKSLAGSMAGTDHQKMVLIDYEIPEKAVGFVMGHNLHKNYYDDDGHAFFSPNRWPGFRPWQDISSFVQGTVLYDLNDNFAKAWDKASGENLYHEREKFKRKQYALSVVKQNKKITHKVSAAQICRTEPSYDEQTILSLYKKAIGNVKNFIYMENQYFRYGPLADYLKQIAKKRKEGIDSCDGSKNDVYLFVVSNIPNTPGETPYTLDMLTRLGVGDQLPKAQRDISLEYKNLYESIHREPGKRYNKYASVLNDLTQLKFDSMKRLYPDLTKELDEKLAKGEEIDEVLRSPQEIIDDEKNREKVENTEDAITMKLSDETGLKVLIGALKSCVEVLPGQYYYTKVYVHSKLMIVDDAFLTLGSTNINTRSFKVDSELNIAVPNSQVAKETREHLWKIHIDKESKQGTSVGDMAKENHDFWKQKMNENWKNMYWQSKLDGHLTYLHEATLIAGEAND